MATQEEAGWGPKQSASGLLSESMENPTEGEMVGCPAWMLLSYILLFVKGKHHERFQQNIFFTHSNLSENNPSLNTTPVFT